MLQALSIRGIHSESVGTLESEGLVFGVPLECDGIASDTEPSIAHLSISSIGAGVSLRGLEQLVRQEQALTEFLTRPMRSSKSFLGNFLTFQCSFLSLGTGKSNNVKKTRSLGTMPV